MKEEFTEIAEIVANESFQKFVLQSDKDAKMEWQLWMRNNPERIQMVEEAKDLLLNLSLQPSEEEISEELFELQNKMQTSIKSSKDIPVISEKEKRGKSSIRYLSLALAANVIGLCIYFLIQIGADRVVEPLVLQTKYGEVLSHRLADGSIVILNGNSTLRISEIKSDASVRKLELKGEAYFDITKTPKLGSTQCEILTSKGKIVVLGTKFNIKNRENHFEIILEEGRINFLSEKEKIEMIPDELVTLTKEGIFEKKTVMPEMYLAWKDHQMIFESASIERVKQRLLDDFGIEVVIENTSMKQKQINANIKNDDPRTLLEALAATHQLELKELTTKMYVLR